MDRSVGLRPTTDLDRALATFLDHPDTFVEFAEIARPHLARYSRRFGAGLPADVCAEIVNETMVGLLKVPEGAFDRRRGRAQAFLAYETRHAARRLRSQYNTPGLRTRTSRRDREEAADA